MVIMGCGFLWIMVLGCLYGTNDYGGAKHFTPRVFKYLFPLISRFVEKGTIMDMVGIVVWHLYLYSWLFFKIFVHKNISGYNILYLKILVIVFVIYAPYMFWVLFRRAKWQDGKF